MYCFVLDNYADSYDNPFFYIWVLCSLISSIYTYTWDVKMDWGLFNKSSGEYTFLREEIVYDNTVSFFLSFFCVKFMLFKHFCSYCVVMTRVFQIIDII